MNEEANNRDSAQSGKEKISGNNNGANQRSDQNDAYELKVKSAYVVQERPQSLGPLPDEYNNKVDDDNDRSSTQNGGKRNRNKKKRPRDCRQSASEKLCLSVIRGDICGYGESCRFSHDLKAYMATRPIDIKTSLIKKEQLKHGEDDDANVDGASEERRNSTRCYTYGCPNYELHGHCIYGAMCRFGSTHVNMATGRNFKIEASLSSETIVENTKASSMSTEHQRKQPVPVAATNVIPKDVQILLRKKKYPFKCKRFFETEPQPSNGDDGDNKNRNDRSNSVPDAAPITSLEKSDNGNEMDQSLSTEKTRATAPVESLRPRKIIDFSNKIYVAPLTTVGNLPFRRIMKQFGADITCGEMALATNLLEGKTSEWALLKRHPDEDVYGVQIAAAHPDQYTRTSELIEKYMDVDFVDLNLGCPLDLVCNKGAGAMMMQRENKLKGSLLGMTKSLSSPITVKMRTGWDINKPFAHRLVRKIQSWQIDGVAAVMLHGRSRLQRYQKESNWKYICEVANSQSDELPKLPIIGNGDIFSYTDYEEKMALAKTYNSKQACEDGGVLSPTAMLARGALIKPWLPTEIKERRHWDISSSERLDIYKDFVRFGLEHWGSDQQGVDNTRRFLLEWLSFLHRYVPVGLLEVLPQQMNQRPPNFLVGRDDLETLMLSSHSADWIKLSEMLLGPIPEGFRFEPKHKARGYA